MTLARFEGYKEATVSGFRSDSGEVRTSTSTNNYDAGGHLLGLTDDTGYDTAHRQFVNDANDANGIVLQKTQQANALKQLVVMGQVMARVVLHATRPTPHWPRQPSATTASHGHQPSPARQRRHSRRYGAKSPRAHR